MKKSPFLSFSWLRIFVFAVTASASVSSCLKLMPDEIALALQDRLAPRITIMSPEDRSGTYSGIKITGTLFDDALSAGDGKGTLRYLSVSAGRNSPHNGGIFINSSGSISRDTNLGSAGVEYRRDTGFFTLTIDNTVDLRGFTNINIIARDISGNAAAKTLVLNVNILPYVVITSPSEIERRISHTKPVLLSGKIGDSVDDKHLFTQINTVRFSIETNDNKGGIMEMRLPDGPDVRRTDRGYEKIVPFLSESNGRKKASFRLSDDGSFSCRFNIPGKAEKGRLITLNVEAVNKHNRSASDSITLTLADIGPVITVFSPPANDKIYYHTESNSIYIKGIREEGLTISAYIGRSYSGVPVKRVIFQIITYKGFEKETELLYEKVSTPSNPDLSGEHTIKEIDIKKYKSFFPSQDSRLPLGAPIAVKPTYEIVNQKHGKDIRAAIHVTAEDGNGNTTTVVRGISEDFQKPRVRDLKYIKKEDGSFTVKFTAYDKETEIDIENSAFHGFRDSNADDIKLKSRLEEELWSQQGPNYRLSSIPSPEKDTFPLITLLIRDLFGNNFDLCIDRLTESYTYEEPSGSCDQKKSGE